MEELLTGGKIIRPAYKSIALPKKYVPIDERDEKFVTPQEYIPTEERIVVLGDAENEN